MIPLKIQLKNFLSYGDLQTINFDPHHLICFVGKNGHGKSALLDAITWALWGQARKITSNVKPDEKLMRLGHMHMMVIFDFISNNQTYRVRREFSYHLGKGQSYLDFGIITTSSGHFKPLTGKTIRATQEVIESIIGLSYEAFINSVFLRQGQSNEFSKKTPQERKELLSAILGLDHYERLRKKAVEKVKQTHIQKEHVTILIQRCKQELIKKETILQELAQNEQEWNTISIEEHENNKKLHNLKDNIKTLMEQEQQLALIALKKKHLEQRKEEQYETLRSAIKSWRSTFHTLLRLNHGALQQEQQKLERASSTLQEKLHQRLQLQEEILHVKNEYARNVQQINNNVSALINKLSVQEREQWLVLNHSVKKQEELKLAQQKNNRELESIEKKILTLGQQLLLKQSDEQKYIDEERQLEKRKNFYQSMQAYNHFIQAELRNAEQKQRALSEPYAECPWCEQVLTVEKAKHVSQTLSQKNTLYIHQSKRIVLILARLKELIMAQHNGLRALKNKIDDYRIIEHSLQELLNKKAGLTQQQEDLIRMLREHTIEHTILEKNYLYISEERKKQESSLPELIKSDSACNMLTEKIGNLEILLQSLEKIAQEYQSVRQALQKVIAQQEVFQDVVKEQPLQDQRRLIVKKSSQAIRQLNQELNELLIQMDAYSMLRGQIIVLAQEEKNVTAQCKNYAHQKELLLSLKGRLEQQLTVIKQQEKELMDLESQMITLDSVIVDYLAISQALGKDGLQALLIENAIPDIEHEANALLVKLTDNQAYLSIESLRDLKSGGTKETLDITISDAAGTRPYELFSGGEAFRIDFALRIAISKLLAKRAGTSLQTLIIDEGFGSQDEEGLAHIMDALYKIQHDFAKIIIVSHLPIMKEQFPTQFIIYKGPQGSCVKVIEQD